MSNTNYRRHMQDSKSDDEYREELIASIEKSLAEIEANIKAMKADNGS